jgi:hypothetical protein
MRNLFLLTGILFLLFACNSDDEPQKSSDTGLNYQPLVTGRFCIYDVSAITKIPGGYDTVRYFLKEQIGNSFISGGDTIYELLRFYRKPQQTDWNPEPEIWTIRRSADRLIRTENNIPFITLTFPVKERLTWNANGLNTLGEDEYKISYVNKSFKLDGKVFPEALLVVQEADTTNLVKRILREEVYARETGLIYKLDEFWNLDFNTGNKTSGYIFEQKFVETGSN